MAQAGFACWIMTLDDAIVRICAIVISHEIQNLRHAFDQNPPA